MKVQGRRGRLEYVSIGHTDSRSYFVNRLREGHQQQKADASYSEEREFHAERMKMIVGGAGGSVEQAKRRL